MLKLVLALIRTKVKEVVEASDKKHKSNNQLQKH
jgi:hypothetical protein